MPSFVLPFPVIDPVIIQLGPVAIRWYAMAYIAGLLLGLLYTKTIVRRDALWAGKPPLTPGHLDDFFFWAVLGVVIGGRLGYVIFYATDVFYADPFSALRVWEGGMSFHGGFLGVTVAMLWFCRANGIPLLSLFDVVAAAAPIGLLFGRIANFINAELWGRVTDAPWAMVFPGAGPLPRHPSQLYEAALEGVLLFLILAWLVFRRASLKVSGLTAGVFVAGYGVFRFLVEFVREPDPQIGLFFGWLSMGMLLSLPMVIAGALLARHALGKAGAAR